MVFMIVQSTVINAMVSVVFHGGVFVYVPALMRDVLYVLVPIS